MNKTIYIPVFLPSLPDKKGFYPVHYRNSATTINEELLFIEGRFHDEDGDFTDAIEWFLMPVSMPDGIPNDEQIQKHFKDNVASATAAAEWMRDQLLPIIGQLIVDKKEHAKEFLESIMSYERESGNAICYDEREVEQLYSIFINKNNPTKS